MLSIELSVFEIKYVSENLAVRFSAKEDKENVSKAKIEDERCRARLIYLLVCCTISVGEKMKAVNILKYAIYAIVQCTWGLLQTMLGLFLFLKYA